MAVNYDSIDGDWKNPPKYSPTKKPSYTHASDKRVVTSMNVVEPKDTASLPEELMIIMEEALEIGVPVQVQFEITPHTALGWTVNDHQFSDAPGLCLSLLDRIYKESYQAVY